MKRKGWERRLIIVRLQHYWQNWRSSSRRLNPRIWGQLPPKLDLAAGLGENDETSAPPNNSNQPPHHETTGTTAKPALEASKHVVNTTGQETALTGTLVNPSTINLKADGGARPKALGNPLRPVKVQPQFDFYLPGGKKISQNITYQINDLTPEGNSAIMVRLPKLQEKYDQEMYMLDQQTGYLYQQHGLTGGFQLVAERGHLHPTESIWADMNEASRKEYLRENDLNCELIHNNNSDQSKVTSTPLTQPEALAKRLEGRED